MLLRAFAPGLAAVLASAAALVSTPVAATAQTSQAGAMQTNGNFIVLKNVGAGVYAYQWQGFANGWVFVTGTTGNLPPNNTNSPSVPCLGGPTQTGGFFATLVVFATETPFLFHHESGGDSFLGSPNWARTMSAPSGVMYGNRVYTVVEFPDDTVQLAQRFFVGSGVSQGWYTNFGYPSNASPELSYDYPPCVAGMAACGSPTRE